MIDYGEITPAWEWLHKYSPAPRHRRRLILKLLKGRQFKQCLDAGCAQPYLLEELKRLHPDLELAGCDISETVIEANRQRFPGDEFFVMDLVNGGDIGKQFDLVTCSEVLEHLPDWRRAVTLLTRLSRRWLLLTVPCGKLYPIDEIVGHRQHFQGNELIEICQINNFQPVCAFRWGFPFHSIYKRLINAISPEKMYESFTQQRCGVGKRIIASMLYGLFFLNDAFRSGNQFVALLERNRT